jgi:guanylate kinase
MKRLGNLFVVSAPSGAGKTTLCQRLKDVLGDIKFSVSYTTRPPREGEINDFHYTFVDEEEFRSMISEGEFIEWAEVHGNLYGTSKKRVEDIINNGFDVLLDIDVQGARKIKDFYPQSVLIFVLPPSIEALRDRLSGRATESEDIIRKRIHNAINEIKEFVNYDYVIINNVLDEAVKDLLSIIKAERLKIVNVDKDWIIETFLKIK